MSSLDSEIKKARMQVHTESYPMSIGELVNMYDDGDLDIHPEFQRVYRWTDEQKSKLIESILLGIPLPSIFVAQREDGVWDVVDGVQRISTILSLLGKLKDQSGKILQPLRLQKTKYLPSLAGKVWEDIHDPSSEIAMDTRRLFKREKIDLKIIKRESESDTKFELFQRLNSWGSRLSPQEVRNCMLLMINESAYEWLKELSQNENFISCTPVSEKQEKESYRHELALRFFTQRHFNSERASNHSDVAPFLDEEVRVLFSKESTFDYGKEKCLFNNTFEIMNNALDESSFKKYNHQKCRYEGAISIPVYEAITIAISHSLEKGEIIDTPLIKSISKQLTNNSKFISALDRKERPLNRMETMANLGKGLCCENKE